MTTLHVINKPEQLTLCQSLLQPEDSVLLIEAAVYLALNPTTLKNTCYVLTEDLIARGLTEKINKTFTVVDYHGFVELVEQHERSHCWQ